jgi:excisionase family DNA binding protein
MSDDAPILTADDLAERWMVSRQTIYDWTRAGALPVIPLPGRILRFRRDAIEEFERKHAHETWAGTRNNEQEEPS